MLSFVDIFGGDWKGVRQLKNVDFGQVSEIGDVRRGRQVVDLAPF